MTSALKDLNGIITIYACGPANTRRGFQNTAADGMRFCSEMAAIANAEVVAATEAQYYHMQGPSSFFDRLFGNGPNDTIRFGA